MNTQSELDRIIHDWLDDRVVEPRPSGLDAVLDRLTTTPQHRRRWLERWLPRGMGATRSARGRGGPRRTPDRHTEEQDHAQRYRDRRRGRRPGARRRTRATGRSRPRAGRPGSRDSVHLRRRAGRLGHFATITEAVAAANDGDTILVKPGTYVEAVTIDKDITLIGDGPRDQIVIENPPDGPMADRTDVVDDAGRAPHFALLVDGR